MRSRGTDSSSRPRSTPSRPSLPYAEPVSDFAGQLQQILADHERATGVRIDLQALRDAAVATAVAEKARLADLKERRHKARAAGRRAGTISARLGATGRVPFLRLSGRWLREAGFDLGQAIEIEVGPGELVIRRA
jgi:hypothetical protein